MTENPNDTLCSTQFCNQIKRGLTNLPCSNDVSLGIYNGIADAKIQPSTDSNLKHNVHIVLENLKRSVEKTYLNDKTNNNNNNNNNNINIDKITRTNINSNNTKDNNGQIDRGVGYCGRKRNDSKKFNSNTVATRSSKGKMSSPESDCNSNVHMNLPQTLATSIASSHDFTHDNSDYQWFLDYNYRENNVTHQSVLSTLSASYNGIGELSYYDDLAKNIDANLAGVDMESFRAEDINLLLSTIPTLCKSNAKKQQEKELESSIFKSKQLFSPVKESILSVDSLDMDCYAEDCDMIITCQANKNNYTIAFEGSTMYDESFYADMSKDLCNQRKNDGHNLLATIDDIVKRKALQVSLCRSESGFTTWSKLKKDSSTQLHRYPSGNNNTSVNVGQRHCVVRKSNSLPNLQIDPIGSNDNCRSETLSTSTIDSYGKQRNLLPMCQIVDSSTQSESPQPLQASSSSNEPQPNQPSFNLVKLFIKQKSNSTDTCMDVSSGCWPSDSSSSVENRHRKKSMYDSGKGSALSKHDEHTHEGEIQYDSLDLPQQPTKKCDEQQQQQQQQQPQQLSTTPKRNASQSNDLYREVFDSPSHRKYKECNLNIRNQHLANVNNNNNNNSMDRDSLSHTIKSISDASRTSDNITQVYARTRLPLNMITKSMQTSMCDEGVKVVPPSFLAQLNQNNKVNEQKQAPVYVIYPNYALPDLGFVKNYQSQVVLSPLGLKETFVRKRRPLSTNDIDYIKKKDYKHIIDWKSLAPLLPNEYKKILQHIPEVQNVMNDPKMSQRPMFCMSPPIRRNQPVPCDCSSYCTNNSSSGSSQQPSSGYRGSSTLLTESELDAISSNSGNNNRIIDENVATDLPPSGAYMRRGILRRASSSTKSKRNSMSDESAIMRNKINEKRCSVQDPYYATGNDVSNAQYYPNGGGDHLDANALKNNLLTGNTKEQLTVEHKEYDDETRNRVEQFLSNVPKSELKYYAEIANILESIDNISDTYDRDKLKNEVSRALSQKHVSFDRDSCQYLIVNKNNNSGRTMIGRGFITPPNSPNISISAVRDSIEQQQQIAKKSKQEKIQSNRFKRLQIQWELLSKDTQQMERELFKETRSGGTTPITATQCMVPRSKIPRPVSYPAAKVSTTEAKSSPSPSRMAIPKKINIAPSTTPVSRPRTPSKFYNTPKKVSPIVKTGTRVK